MIIGTSASPGVVIGKALLINEEELNIVKYISTLDLEEARLGQAIQSAKLELNDLREKTLKTLGNDKALIFEAHLMILEDPELLKQTLAIIKNQSVNAEFALNTVANKFIAVFESMEDAYMRERASDIRDVYSEAKANGFDTKILRKVVGIRKKNHAERQEEEAILELYLQALGMQA